MPDRKIVELFLRMVHPLDDPEYDHLWKCIAAIFVPTGKTDRITSAVAAQNIDDLLTIVDSRVKWNRADIYTCMTTQKEVMEDRSRDGFHKVSRTYKNAATCSSLFCDIDVGKGGCYATTADAELGLQKFLGDSGMPEPSMKVYSGSGGMHCYWCTTPMPIAEWEPLAQALKACAKDHDFRLDPAVTADAARILRVPSTINWKSEYPVPVRLDMGSTFNIYDKDALAGPLQPYVQARSTPRQSSTGPAPNLTGTSANFASGISEGLPPVPVDDVAAVCPVTADILARGGNGDKEPLWNIAMLLASFTSDPVDAAHRMSCGDPRYVAADTDKKLQEKQKARAANNKIGWPTCSEISGHHAACKTCPFFAANKTPFHFVVRGPSAQSPLPHYKVDPLMPEGFWRNSNDHVFTDMGKGPFDVLGMPIKDGFIASRDGIKVLVAQMTIGGDDIYVDVDTSKHGPQQISEAWHAGSRRNFVVTSNLSTIAIKAFTMAWMQHLRAQHKSIVQHGFGWTGDNFIFGDNAYTPTGPQLTYRGNTLDEKYERRGELKPWQDALELIYGNPPLEIMVATAFASPLVQLHCDNSLVVSVYSAASGYGKTTAMKIAQAVWGHPRTGMSALDDTANAVADKMGRLRNLPIYWDELKTQDQSDKLVALVFGASGGKGKQRLTRDIKQAEVSQFTTMFVIASNRSLMDPVVAKSGATEAGAMRVFELEAKPLHGVRLDSDQLIIPLNDNYGVAGAIYADWIARYRETCIKMLKLVDEELHALCSFTPKERFWRHTMTTIIVAAYIAKQAGLVQFNTAMIQNFLIDRLNTLRSYVKNKQHYTLADIPSDDLLLMMVGDTNGRNLIETEYIPPSTRPGRNWHDVKITNTVDPQRLGDIWLQTGEIDGRVLVRLGAFEEWCLKRGWSPVQVLDAFEKDYYVVKARATIGKGVFFMKGGRKKQSWCYDMTPKVPPVVDEKPKLKKTKPS